MMHKWKQILANWINCYFNEGSRDLKINLDSLLDIISHLRDNLNLDESKSSVLEAHTIKEFIQEKYPSFKFKNGTLEPIDEDEIYVAASLLLFFVCVNSKDVVIKNAMCSKLSLADQEIILKFSKSLMECREISSAEVLLAITEACGQDIAAVEPVNNNAVVAETPPALRSLHSEVRRLQAALDAERFDRNYLQEELSRTNLKMEKLLKDKEQYKLDIVNLKAKISFCCGQESESKASDIVLQESAKLSRQLEETEERLLQAQEQLDDVQYERDMCKSKLNDLKRERDNWQLISQQESSRAVKLAEELEAERNQVHSLRELVSELKQHNRLNGLDSSQLECDDPDASSISLQHNSSVCSEACVNVIEVQLVEERAKIVSLKQQIQMLQEQLMSVNEKAVEEREKYAIILSERDTDIFSLKHRINEEIEDKNILKAHLDNQITKLNNEINELEQRLKNNGEHYRNIIDRKMYEIQKLQEEKLSLLQSLSDETTKLENIIKDLKRDVDVEKSSKLKMKDDYDNHVMKLNEKIGNRNNELVELQNKIFEKGEQIEQLQMKLRKEKEMQEQIISSLQQKDEDIQQLQLENQSLHNELNVVKMELQTKVHSLNDKLIDNKQLTEKLKVAYESQIHNLNTMISELTNYLKDKTSELDLMRQQKEELQQAVDDNNNVISNLNELLNLEKEQNQQVKDHNNIEKLALIEKSTLLQEHLIKAENEVEENRKEIVVLKEKISLLNTEKEEVVRACECEINNFNITISELTNNLREKTLEVNSMRVNKENLQQIFDGCKNDIINLEEVLKLEREQNQKVQEGNENEKSSLIKKITLLQEQKTETEKKLEVLGKEVIVLKGEIFMLNTNKEQVILGYSSQIDNLNITISKLTEDLEDKTLELNSMSAEKDNLQQVIEDKNKVISNMEILLENLKEQSKKFQENYENEKRNLIERSSVLQDFKIKSENELEEQRSEMIALKEQINTLNTRKEEAVTNYEGQLENLNIKVSELTNDLRNKASELKALTKEIQNSRKINDEDKQVISNLEKELKREKEMINNLLESNESKKLNLAEKNTLLLELKINAEKELEEREKEITALKDEVNLLNTKKEQVETACESQLEELNIMVSKLTKDLKDKSLELEAIAAEMDKSRKINDDDKEVISNLEKELKQKKELIQKLQDNNESEIIKQTEKNTLLQKFKDTAERELENQSREITELKEEINVLNMKQEQAITNYKYQIKNLNDTISKLINNLKDKALELEDTITEMESLRKINDENEEVILNLEKELKHEKEFNQKLQENNENEKLIITEASTVLQQSKIKTDKELEERSSEIIALKEEIKVLNMKQEQEVTNYECQIINLNDTISKLTNDLKDKALELEATIAELEKSQEVNVENKEVIASLEEILKYEKEQKQKIQEDNEIEKSNLTDEKTVLQEYQTKAESELEKQKKEIVSLKEELNILNTNKEEAATEYECQINNFNVMTCKLTNELKDKVLELDTMRVEKESLQKIIDKNNEVISNLEKILKHKAGNEDSEKFRLENQTLHAELNEVKTELETKVLSLKDKLVDNEHLTEKLKETYECQIDGLNNVISKLTTYLKDKTCELDFMKQEQERLHQIIDDNNNVISNLEKTQKNNENEKLNLIEKSTLLQEYQIKAEKELDEQKLQIIALKEEVSMLNTKKEEVVTAYECQLKDLNTTISKLTNNLKDKIVELKTTSAEKEKLKHIIEDNNAVISNLEKDLRREREQNQKAKENNDSEKLNLMNKGDILQEYQIKAEKELEKQAQEIISLKEEINMLNTEIRNKDESIINLIKEKDAIIYQLSCEILEEKRVKEEYFKEVADLQQKLDLMAKKETEQMIALKKENEVLVKAVGLKETYAITSEEKSSPNYIAQAEKEPRYFNHQVDDTQLDNTHSSTDSYKTIADLEKIVQDKNRKITTLQSDVTYLKSLMAESENKLLDVSNELEISKENCIQLSNQLKKIVYQKNEEIAELKKQVIKMSATENRASQIIKVSAKYQAIILKRIAEIKNNTVLKELTNFGNTANCDNELRRSLNAGTITMEDLENFLETTEKHLRRCSEKQIALQKERDRLTEVNKINESEIINMRKFLTELSVSIKTFNSIKELYTQKLSRVVSLQRTVRREILNLDGHIKDATMYKLERGFAAVTQDLSECAMSLERWVERCISRAISAEKMKAVFTSDNDRNSVPNPSFQNTSLEVQLDELENSFHKLLEEVLRAQKGEGAKDAQEVTLMEVRAEYEDKLNRMKTKMKELYHEQISILKGKQGEQIASLQNELKSAKDKLEACSREYEQHIKALTIELWNVGEKYLMEKNEAEWFRKKQRCGSLMSLQHVHSSGLVPPPEEPSRPSDTHSLRSLPVNSTKGAKAKDKEGRGLHMSDEEGEVFDNRWLRELTGTPRAAPRDSDAGGGAGAGHRLSELRWRNSLCPPHLKSSYPAETQFAATLHEEEIKATNMAGRQRKEVGITAYKKPGPPTPSKQAGRLSATDSELRESLRVEADPSASRKTTTPSRIRSLFRSNKNDTAEGTPRSRRLSNIFRKK